MKKASITSDDSDWRVYCWALITGWKESGETKRGEWSNLQIWKSWKTIRLKVYREEVVGQNCWLKRKPWSAFLGITGGTEEVSAGWTLELQLEILTSHSLGNQPGGRKPRKSFLVGTAAQGRLGIYLKANRHAIKLQ